MYRILKKFCDIEEPLVHSEHDTIEEALAEIDRIIASAKIMYLKKSWLIKPYRSSNPIDNYWMLFDDETETWDCRMYIDKV